MSDLCWISTLFQILNKSFYKSYCQSQKNWTILTRLFHFFPPHLWTEQWERSLPIWIMVPDKTCCAVCLVPAGQWACQAERALQTKWEGTEMNTLYLQGQGYVPYTRFSFLQNTLSEFLGSTSSYVDMADIFTSAQGCRAGIWGPLWVMVRVVTFVSGGSA